MDRKKLDCTIGLKGLFILIIVFYHTNDSFINDFAIGAGLDFLKRYGGYFGNIMFFMLSGFLISYGYKNKIIAGQVGFSEYIIKRLKRIYPLYFITMVVSAALTVLYGGVVTFKGLVLNATFLITGWIEDVFPYNVPAWFVCVLFLCYIIFFAVCKYSKSNERFILLSIALVIWGYVLENRGWTFPLCYSHTGEGIINFFMGCILFEFYQKITGMNKVKRIYIAQLISIIVFALFSLKFGFQNVSGDVRIVFLILICPAIIITTLEINVLNRVMNSWIIKKTGLISMSIYFWHMPVLMVFNILNDRGIINVRNRVYMYLLYFLILLCISIFSYIYIEKPKRKKILN